MPQKKREHGGYGYMARERLLRDVRERAANAALLAEVVRIAAYTGKADPCAVEASCEALREYLKRTWDMAGGYQTE